MAELEFAAAFLAKKGEDVSAHHDATLPDGSRLALFLVADGHGGAAVAVHLREQLLPAVVAGCADGTPASVEGALRAAFASLHAECQSSRFARAERRRRWWRSTWRRGRSRRRMWATRRRSS